MKRILALVMIASCLAGCRHSKPLLSDISGKAGEVVVVLDEEGWNGELGNEVRNTLGADCPYFVIPEPMYSIIHVSPASFTNLFNVHRNIVFFEKDSTRAKASFDICKDVWAQPQFVARITAKDNEGALEAFRKNSHTLIQNLEQAERNRVISAAVKYGQKDIAPSLEKVFGGSIAVPSGYSLRKITDDFAWIELSRETSTQAVFIYKYPADENPFELENIIRHRDEMMKTNVPGPRDSSYVFTSTGIMEPTVEYLKYQGREFAQTRGWWEVEGDFMGGPFTSESFYSPDGREIICTEAFLYHPKDEKRLAMRQTEALLYSWKWAEKGEEK